MEIEDKLEIDKIISDTNYKLAFAIRQVLHYKNITIHQLAEFLNINRSRLDFMLSGEYDFSIRMIAKIEVVIQQNIIKIG